MLGSLETERQNKKDRKNKEEKDRKHRERRNTKGISLGPLFHKISPTRTFFTVDTLLHLTKKNFSGSKKFLDDPNFGFNFEVKENLTRTNDQSRQSLVLHFYSSSKKSE